VTGRSERTFVGGAWVGGSTGRFRGLRLLCYPCATAIDRANSYDPALDLPEETQKAIADIWPPSRLRAWNDVGAWAIVAIIFLPIAIALVSHYSVPQRRRWAAPGPRPPRGIVRAPRPRRSVYTDGPLRWLAMRCNSRKTRKSKGLRAARGSSEAGMRRALLPVVAIRPSFPPEAQCRALLLPKLGIEVQPPQPLSTPRPLGVRNSIPRRHFNSTEPSSDNRHM
jgi:hypothetical protein